MRALPSIGGDGLIAGRRTPTSTHWGNYDVEVRGHEVVALHPVADDPDPSPIGLGMPRAQNGAGRILRPAVRRGWLEGEGGAARGQDAFVEVGWDEALDLAARELARVKERAWQRRDLRRLLWLGQRGALPSPAGPAASLPQLPRRLHGVRQQLQLRGHGGHPAARDRRALRRDLLVRPALGRDRRAHRADRRVRRPGDEEHPDQLGWSGATPRTRRAARRPEGGRRLRQRQPDARRRRRRPGRALARTAPEHRRGADDGPRPQHDRVRDARPELPERLLRRLGGAGGIPDGRARRRQA